MAATKESATGGTNPTCDWASKEPTPTTATIDIAPPVVAAEHSQTNSAAGSAMSTGFQKLDSVSGARTSQAASAIDIATVATGSAARAAIRSSIPAAARFNRAAPTFSACACWPERA